MVDVWSGCEFGQGEELGMGLGVVFLVKQVGYCFERGSGVSHCFELGW